MSVTNVSILGASSHIAKGLIHNFKRAEKTHLHLFTSSLEKTNSFIHDIAHLPEDFFTVRCGYEEFGSHQYDVVINCIGVGTQKQLRGDFTKYFSVGEKYDNMVIEYLLNSSPETLYISFSSGAVYGRSFAVPATEWTENNIKVNHVAPEDYYSICKLNSEAKHRAFSNLNIVDLRLFSYFSRYIDMADGYFITDVIESIKNNKILATDSNDMVRDYVHPDDLYAVIMACINCGKLNDAFDVMSTKPASKSEILTYFADNFGLRLNIEKSISSKSPTGLKNVYYSQYDKLSALGFHPKFSSMDTIKLESQYLLGK